MGIVFYIIIRIIDSKCMTALDCSKLKAQPTHARLNVQAELNAPPIVVPPIVVPVVPAAHHQYSPYSPHVLVDCPDCSQKNQGA
jgi:hypothetical protein